MCWKCGEAIAPDRRVGFRELCEACGAELHSCRNCRFYKPGAYRDCMETIDEAVIDKERMNFCEYFRPSGRSAKGSGGDKADAARSDFDSLFS
jgi:hypothetical protein